jgi:hypothetical protein
LPSRKSKTTEVTPKRAKRVKRTPGTLTPAEQLKADKKLAREAKRAAKAERLRRRDPARMTPEEAAATLKSRERKLKLFNMTLEDDFKVREFQNHACAITGERYRKDGVPLLLNLDHNHLSGRVRGYLRGDINKALEYFHDDPILLRRAADYLERPPVTEALGEIVYGVLGRSTKRVKSLRYGPPTDENPKGTKTPQPRASITKLQETSSIK